MAPSRSEGWDDTATPPGYTLAANKGTRMRRLSSLFVLAIAAVPLAGHVQAQEPPDQRGTLSLTVENDLFGGSDRYYTNGLLLTWRSPTENLPWPLDMLDRGLNFAVGPGQLRWGLSLGQNMYTPQDTQRRNPDPNDRPYAGYLYGAASLTRTTERTQTIAEVQLGVVGPSALGEFVQNNYHDLLNIKNAEGWDRQLKDEPAATLLLERRWRLPLGNAGSLQAEAIPVLAGAVGNVQTYASIGTMLRIGDGLDADWGPVRIRPALAGSGFFQPRQDFGWYVFAGVEGRAVARDIFLDGNTWRDGPRVDKRPFVGDAQAGVAVLWRGVRLAYTHVLRSEEFYGQGGVQSFGSFSASFRF
ncbi:lipid A deacylase LpxR family protein [Roseomonas xinghualingensis]|uniref:lipid A deacylase LpxR family protein n=1 Tax=Roseomonas xinghualingensis TaxID=2986475 RepID=UPI0021F214C0|nr:lipid A deacylase LpxR family protein [Roseomonas sp. SXEYE001]MCV4209166.1 lipid A deacylase LpxR family protein [Roseomonas sp. SXEYE001]